MLAEFIFAGLVVGGLGVAYVANDTETTCKDEASKLPPTVPAPCSSLATVALARWRCAHCLALPPACPFARPPQPPSGARCPVRPPDADEAISAILLAMPDPDEKEFRTLPNSL